MQHRSKTGVLLAMLVAAVVAVVILLSTKDIPVTQKPVEKQLDAKAFLEQKP